MKSPKIIVKMLGLFFLASAVLKGIDPASFSAQISYFGMFHQPWIVQYLTLSLIGVEAVLGTLLLLGLQVRRISLPIAAILLIFFTLLLGYGWTFRNIENCGCFGKYLPMTPAEAIIKNFVLLLLMLYAWLRLSQEQVSEAIISTLRSSHKWDHLRWRVGLVVTGALLITGFAAFQSQDTKDIRPSGSENLISYSLNWNNQEYHLAEGIFLLALLSDSCSHCTQDVAELNRLVKTPGFPKVTGLILGEEESLRAFRVSYKPEFPTALVPVLDFLNLIGDAPPRFILLKDGRQLRYWDEHVPAAEIVMNALSGITTSNSSRNKGGS